VAAEGDTAAVRATLAPVVVLVEEDERAVVVAVGELDVTVMLTALEVLVA
jgi:PHD/YefM family antitoxin component YafN of YafNO toxin-antitoxin module